MQFRRTFLRGCCRVLFLFLLNLSLLATSRGIRSYQLLAIELTEMSMRICYFLGGGGVA